MISTELLSEVLGIDVAKIIENSDRNISIYERDFKYPMSYNASAYLTINIHELAHKCKEWAHKLGFMVQSYQYNTKARVDLLKSCDIDEIFIEETEPEAIFKACEWILKEHR